MGFGAEIGYQLWDSGFALDLGIEPMYTIAKGGDSENELKGIRPSATSPSATDSRLRSPGSLFPFFRPLTNVSLPLIPKAITK